MNRIETHLQALAWARQLIEMTMRGVTAEQAHWQPPGVANPLGATYAHAICSLDAICTTLLQGTQPLFATVWSGRTGFSDPQWPSEITWARQLAVDLDAAHAYAAAVFDQAERYLASLRPADLARELDLAAFGLGVQSVNWCVNALVVAHLHNMAGEISVLKGLQGAQGYPF